MKKSILILLFAQILFNVQMDAQQVNAANITQSTINPYLHEEYPLLINLHDTVVNSKADLIKRHNSQQTIGWVMLGGGAVMALTGGLLVANNFQLFSNENDGATIAGSVLFLVGVGSAIGSIPVFVSAAKNGRKAASISVTQQKTHILVKNTFGETSQLAVTVKIHL